MTDVLIPYSFVPGTKAMASEVNANFIALAQGVEDCKNYTTQILKEFNEEVDSRLDEAIGEKLDFNLSNSVNITNCFLEIPQRIKYTLVDGTLTIEAGSVAIIPYGVEDLSATYPVGATFINGNFKVYDTCYAEGKFFVWVELINDIVATTEATTDTYMRSVVINLAENRMNIIVDSYSGTGYTDTTNTTSLFYYNVTTNEVQQFEANCVKADGVRSLPIMCVQANGTKICDSVCQVFNGFSYIGQCTFVDKGVKALLPNGRNEDGTLKNIETVTTAITITDLSGQHSVLGFFDGKHLFACTVDNYIVQDSQPTITTTHAMWYCPRENFVYSTSDGGATWLVTEKIYAGLLTKTEATGSITYMTPKNTFKAVDYNEFDIFGSLIGQCGTGFYKLNNGLIVQWGSVSVGASSSVVVTLPAPFSSANYMALTSMYDNGTSGSEKNWQTSTLTTTSFKAHNGQGGKCKFGWIAVGI